MRNRKATGDDDIPGDVIKLLGEGGLKILTKLCNTIYNTGEWPQDFTEVKMIALKKKTKATKCSDYRTISLIAHTAKIIAKILRRSGDRGSTAVKVLCYKSEGRWFDPSWCRNFSLTLNPSDRTMDLGSTQPLTEMSTRSISCG